MTTRVTSWGVLRAVLLGCLLAGCAKQPAAVEAPRATPRSSSSITFARRPLAIEIEGTSERRQRYDLTFLGFEVLGAAGQSDMRVIAQALNRYLNLPVAQITPPLDARCNTFTTDCVASVGTSLGAKHLLLGTLQFDDGSLTVTLVVIDAAAKRVLRDWSERLAMVELSHDTARQLVDRGRLAVLGAGDSTLLVESEVDGTVYVDGILFGKLAVPHTSVRLRPGKHRIKIVSRGYSSTEKELDIPASHFVRVVVKK